jgi:hypothetical protein
MQKVHDSSVARNRDLFCSFEGQAIESIPEKALEDCCQLVKANSIEGCKLSKVDIVYTPVGNLRQTNDMDVGQVGFHVDKNVRCSSLERDTHLL